MEDVRLIRLEEVTKRVSLCKSTIYTLIKEGSFPAPIKIRKSSLWSNRQVTDWIEKQVETNG